MSELPIITGFLWCIFVGSNSSIRPLPVVAIPPACSVIKAIGLLSNMSLSFQFGESVVEGYMNMPPLSKFR